MQRSIILVHAFAVNPRCFQLKKAPIHDKISCKYVVVEGVVVQLKKDMAFVMQKDAYAFHMMNLIDYLVGNTDRHWGNWGFLVSNDTNRLEKLYPLMDFNKSFLSYDTLDGARCQASSRKLTQREAAIEAVRAVGLNQIAEVKAEWFKDATTRDMFFRRLEAVRSTQTK